MIYIKNILHYKNNFFTIYTDITEKCNFTCDYCCTKTYRTSNKQLNLILFLTFLNTLNINKKILLILLGGEPTLHNNLILFILINKNKEINIFTNFSADINVYEELLKNNVILSLSIHYNNNNILSDIIYKYIQLSKIYYNNIYVTIMYDDKHINYSINCFNLFLKIFKQNNIPLELLNISKIENTETYKVNYNYLLKLQFKYYKSLIPVKSDEIYEYNNNKFIQIISEDNMFNIFGNNLFKNWKCNASVEGIYVNTDGNIYPCNLLSNYSIKNKYIIGNIINGFKYKNILCPYTTYCNMPYITKYKIFNSK